MDHQEAELAYRSLISALQDNGLNWVVQQLEQTIALGKPESKKVRTFRDNPGQAQLLPGPQVELTATTEYSSQERLVLAIDAIEQAVLHVQEMEVVISSELTRIAEDHLISHIVFVSEQGNSESEPLSNAVDRINSITSLKSLLSQLRELVDVNGQEFTYSN